MSNYVSFFAVHADDVARAKRFYESVFGWKFTPWGPPDFYLIAAGPPGKGIRGALEKRQEPLTGTGFRGYECSIAVASVDAVAKAIPKHGGTITMPKAAIPTVGQLIKFEDTEGNRACAIQYEEGAG
jgi:uncharacterized protein